MRSFYSLFKNMHPVKGTLWSGRCQLPGTLFLFVFISVLVIGFCDAKVSSKIDCDEDEMRVEITGPHIREAYLKGLKNYPEPTCQPDRISSDLLKFRLSLRDFYRCGTSQILNKITGSRTFYNHLIIETIEEDLEILVKCQQKAIVADPFDSNHINATFRFKRDVLPAGFIEDDTIKFGRDQIGHAPDPMLTMVVKQDGRTIGQELLVSPGAPLQMEVNLDSKSTDVYGIIVAQLEVTDTSDQSEAILLNACSVDPYLFENFVTADGDLLTAKFRAFKFPDSNYVLFKGTVNVCLGICQPSQCSNGQIGYGRRRRSINMGENYGLYEFQMNTLLRIANEDPASPYPQERFILSRSRRLISPDAEYRKDSIQAEYSTSHSCSRELSNPFVLIASLAVSILLASFVSGNSHPHRNVC